MDFSPQCSPLDYYLNLQIKLCVLEVGIKKITINAGINVRKRITSEKKPLFLHIYDSTVKFLAYSSLLGSWGQSAGSAMIQG